MTGTTLPPSPDHPAPDDDELVLGHLPGPPRPPAPVSFRERLAAVADRVPVSRGRLVALVVAALLVVVAAAWLLRPPPPPVESTLPRATSTGSTGAVAAPSTTAAPTSVPARVSVVVDAAGSVNRPGLYRLTSGARINDLIRAAGGLRADADANRLNLAALLADGQRLYVPKVGELDPPLPVDPTGSTGAGSGPASTPQGSSPVGNPSAAGSAPVDLNTASAEQLDTLPGVGPSTAASIIDYRAEHGRFHSVDELLDVRGIGDAKLAALRSKVRV